MYISLCVCISTYRHTYILLMLFTYIYISVLGGRYLFHHRCMNVCARVRVW